MKGNRKQIVLTITDEGFKYSKSNEIESVIDMENFSIKFNEFIDIFLKNQTKDRLPKIIIPCDSKISFSPEHYYARIDSNLRSDVEINCGDNCAISVKDNLKLTAGKRCSIAIFSNCDLDLQKKCTVKYYHQYGPNIKEKLTKIKFKGSVEIGCIGSSPLTSLRPIPEKIISMKSKTIFVSNKPLLNGKKLYLTEEEKEIYDIIT